MQVLVLGRGAVNVESAELSSLPKQHSMWAPVGPQLGKVGPQMGPGWARLGPIWECCLGNEGILSMCTC